MIDPSIVTIIVAILGGGTVTKIIDVAAARWQQAQGKRHTSAQREAEYREALARARFMLSERGVPEEQLPDYPT